MGEQISLPGFDSAPTPAVNPKTKPVAKEKPKSDATDRLFFAVIPDSQAIKAIRQCTNQLQSRYRVSNRSIIIDGRLHISLLGLGDFVGEPKKLVEIVSHAAAMVSLSAFDACFDQVLTFGNPKSDPLKSKPCVLVGSADNTGLMTLQRSLIASLQKIMPFDRSPPSFNPHITVLYDRQLVPTADVTPITWQVKEFVLVRSLIGDNRRPYDILARWPLLGSPVTHPTLT